MRGKPHLAALFQSKLRARSNLVMSTAITRVNRIRPDRQGGVSVPVAAACGLLCCLSSPLLATTQGIAPATATAYQPAVSESLVSEPRTAELLASGPMVKEPHTAVPLVLEPGATEALSLRPLSMEPMSLRPPSIGPLPTQLLYSRPLANGLSTITPEQLVAAAAVDYPAMDTVADGPVAAEEADTRANRPASVVHTGDGVAQADANTHEKTDHDSAATDAEHRHTTLDEPPDADHQHQHTSDALHARPTLTLREALTRAVTRHPRLLANAYQLISQDARTEQAGARPDPTVNFLLENAFGTDVYEGVDATETTLGLTWLLEGERRQARVEVSSRLASKLATEARIQRLEVAAATANQFVDVLVFQALQQHTQRQLAQAEDALAVTQHQLDAGLASVVEVGLTQLDVARAQLAADDVEHELLVARHALAAQWGDAAPDFGVLEGTITQLPAPLPFDTLLSQIEASPLLSVYATERRVAEAQLKHADLTQAPQWELNANIRHFGLGDDLALVGGFNVTLPSKQRYNGRKAELIAEQARADANQQAHRTELTQTLYAQHSAMSHSLHVYDELAHKVLPTLERTLASARQQYTQGQLPYSDLRRLQQEYWLMRAETLQAAANAHRQKIAIERLTGAVLTTVSQEDTSS